MSVSSRQVPWEMRFCVSGCLAAAAQARVKVQLGQSFKIKQRDAPAVSSPSADLGWGREVVGAIVLREEAVCLLPDYGGMRALSGGGCQLRSQISVTEQRGPDVKERRKMEEGRRRRCKRRRGAEVRGEQCMTLRFS